VALGGGVVRESGIGGLQLHLRTPGHFFLRHVKKKKEGVRREEGVRGKKDVRTGELADS